MTVDAILNACGRGDVRLNAASRFMLSMLDKMSKGHGECWSPNKSFVHALGCCERTIRGILKKLVASGLIRIVRDYSLRSRRRIILLWKNPDASMTANTAPQ